MSNKLAYVLTYLTIILLPMHCDDISGYELVRVFSVVVASIKEEITALELRITD